jgi:hypothetical protein
MLKQLLYVVLTVYLKVSNTRASRWSHKKLKLRIGLRQERGQNYFVHPNAKFSFPETSTDKNSEFLPPP